MIHSELERLMNTYRDRRKYNPLLKGNQGSLYRAAGNCRRRVAGSFCTGRKQKYGEARTES